MSDNIVVRYAEDVCCPHCIKLFPLADGLLRSPMWVPEAGRELLAVSAEQKGAFSSIGKRTEIKRGGS